MRSPDRELAFVPQAFDPAAVRRPGALGERCSEGQHGKSAYCGRSSGDG